MSKTITPENITEELAATRQKAAEAFATAENKKAELIKAGVNLMDPAHQDKFDEVDGLYKAYDTLRDEGLQMEEKLSTLQRIDGYGTRGDSPLPRADRGRLDERGGHRSIGERLTSSEQYKNFGANAFTSDIAFSSAMARGFDRPIEIATRDELKALLALQRFGATAITGSSATSGGPFIQNELMPGYIAFLRKNPTIASIVGQGVTDSDVVEYVKQTAVTNAAAETAEGVAAPEATYAFSTETTNVQEITHWVPITRRAMADAGQLQSIAENNLGMDIYDRLDTQLAAGGGGGDLTGIYNVSGIGTQPLGGDVRADAVHKAMTQIRVAAGVLMEPDYIGMHPNDWQKLRLEKDANGAYLFGPPNADITPSAWGFPVIPSTVFTAGTPLVGNFARSATLWLREGLSIQAGLNADDLTKRRMTLIAALRAAFAVTRPGGFCSVTGF